MAFYFKPWTHWHEVPQETYNTLKRLSYGKEHLREDNLAKRGTLNVVAAFGGSNTFPGAESASMVEVQQRGRKGVFPCGLRSASQGWSDLCGSCSRIRRVCLPSASV